MFKNNEVQYLFITKEEVERFVADWRRLANTLRSEFDERGASLIEKRAQEVESWFSSMAEDEITIGVASQATGYSADHLRRTIGSGELANAGVRGKPRVRRGDLRPKRIPIATKDRTKYDVTADVRALRVRRGE